MTTRIDHAALLNHQADMERNLMEDVRDFRRQLNAEAETALQELDKSGGRAWRSKPAPWA